MTDYASARDELQAHVDRAVSPQGAIQRIGEVLLDVSISACGTGRTEHTFGCLFGEARKRHARGRGRS